ncbi:MAG: type III pantothenate kinase [Bacteroidales bacterium]|nr:type III pantothenate kinase [Bacteroidales bacterium]
MNLAVDIGNSAVKAGIFKNDKPFRVMRFNHDLYQKILDLVLQYKIENVIISSVKEYSIPGATRLKQYLKHYIELSSKTLLPVKNCYQTPETLGKDRIAAAIGGISLYPGCNILVIDAGTALTFDFVNKDQEYIGGNISPGLSMRYRALHQFTNNLPLLQKEEDFELLGENTNKAIIRGVQNGIIFEMNNYIESLSVRNGNLTTILTGGDSNFFDNKLKYPIFVEPDLVLIGLNKILKYNLYAH